MALKVLSLPTHANPRIVALLEDTLARAKEGKVTGLFLYVEDENGQIEHSRDGMPDNQVIFAMELIKKRMLARYE
jgi:hypothetical protein